MKDQNNELYSNKSNQMIQNYAWNLKEKQLKIMELLCSCYMTNYYDAEKNTVTVGVADFMRELGLTTKGVNSKEYAVFRESLKKLSDFSIIGIGFNGRERLIRMINTFEYLPNTNQIKCFMSDDYKESMKLQLKGNTKIEFRTICNMNSRFSIKLYNLLRSWQGQEDVYFDLDYLKEVLNVTAKSYDNFAKFRQAVLDVAVTEINDKTSLDITYKPITGRGRRVTRVVFYIKNKASKKVSSLKNNYPGAAETVQKDIPEDIQIFRSLLRDGGREFTDEKVRAMRTAALSSEFATYLRQIPGEADMVEARLDKYVRMQEDWARANTKYPGGLANYLIKALRHDIAGFYITDDEEEDNEEKNNEGKQLDLPSFFENA